MPGTLVDMTRGGGASTRASVTLAIVAANLLVFAAMLAAGADPFTPSIAVLARFGAISGVATHQPWRLLTSSFVHMGVEHLLLNLILLWDAGHLVEGVLGRARFAGLYAAGSVGSGLAGIAAHPLGLSAGASGSVFGVYGALGAYLLRQQRELPGPVNGRVRRAGIVFLGFNVLALLSKGSPDVAGHLGGLAVGAVVGAWLTRPSVRRHGATEPTILLLATVLVGAATPLLLPRPAILASLERFTEEERGIVARFEARWAEWQQGRLSTSAASDALQAEVLEPWREARGRLPGPEGLGPSQLELLEAVKRYAAAREDFWSAMATGLRQGWTAERTAEAEARGTAFNLAAEELERSMDPERLRAAGPEER
jgi:rhomboid protease GluP